MLLSIVLVTYNRSAFIKQTLLALENQTDMEFQVIVASDNSSDDTEAMLATLETSYDLKWLNTHCPDYGLAVARNQGIIASDGEAVVILDDDSVPRPDFVAAHKRGVKPGIITGGPRWPHNQDDDRMAWKATELCKVPDLTPLPITQHRQKWPNAYLIENNICMMRDDIIRLGMFSERVKLYGYIGQEFFARAAYLDYAFQVNHAAAIDHYGEIEGDNGLFRSRKMRETWWSTLLRPSLLRPHHYDAQINWAAAQDKGKAVAVSSWPPYWPHALFSVPIGLILLGLRKIKQRIRPLFRRGS